MACDAHLASGAESSARFSGEDVWELFSETVFEGNFREECSRVLEGYVLGFVWENVRVLVSNQTTDKHAQRQIDIFRLVILLAQPAELKQRR